MWFKVKKILISTYGTLLLLLYAPPFWSAPIFIKLFVLRSEGCSDWPAIQLSFVIGRIPQAWDGNVTHPYRIVMPCLGAMSAIKPIINETFIASSGEIMTDYNDLYCLFTHHIASHRVNITMSAFVIRETTSTSLHSSKLVFESSVTNSLNKKTYLVSQKRQTCWNWLTF